MRFPSPSPNATVRAAVEYDGTAFHGFQRQPAARTVAGVLEDALADVFGERVAITGAGRTDTGVHATGQVISFALPRPFPLERLAIALQTCLSRDVSVRDVAKAPAEFSARHSARTRTYVYAVLNDREPSALLARYTWHVRRALDLAAMREAAGHLTGERDFRSFCALPESGATVRRLDDITIESHGNLVRLSVTANGFLHHMVRTIAGTLVECGHGRRDPASIPGVIAALHRSAAGMNAPPQGLYLAGVRYDDYDSYREPWIFATLSAPSP